jgi:hypothetical protein
MNAGLWKPNKPAISYFARQSRVALTHINTNRGDRRPQTLRDRFKEGLDPLLLPIKQDANQPQFIIGIFLAGAIMDQGLGKVILHQQRIAQIHRARGSYGLRDFGLVC